MGGEAADPEVLRFSLGVVPPSRGICRYFWRWGLVGFLVAMKTGTTITFGKVRMVQVFCMCGTALLALGCPARHSSTVSLDT